MAERLLGQRGRIRVVLHHQVRPEAVPQPAQHLGLAPAGQPAGDGELAQPRVVHPGAADHGLGDRGAGHAHLSAQPVGQPDQLGDPAAHAGRPAAHRLPGADLAAQVGQRAAQVLLADVQAEHEPGVGPDLVQPGAAPGHPGAVAGRPDQPGPLHVRHGQRHGGLGQPGQPGQVGPRARAELADLAEQQLLVELPDELRTRGLAAWRGSDLGA